MKPALTRDGSGDTMPRGKGIYDDEKTDPPQRGKSEDDQGDGETTDSPDTPDVDSSETQEPPD
jgi:hypothetical protein